MNTPSRLSTVATLSTFLQGQSVRDGAEFTLYRAHRRGNPSRGPTSQSSEELELRRSRSLASGRSDQADSDTECAASVP